MELDSAAVVIFPETSEVMIYTVLEGAEGTNNFIFKLIDDSLKINFFKPDTNLIKSTCVLYGVDGIIIANLKFIHVTYSVYFVPIAQNFDTEVELKLFDKYGNLVIQTLHNTYKGNSYMMPPEAETTVRDGVRGALRRLVKELQKLQSDQQ